MALDAVLGKASVAIRAALEDLDKDLEGARSKVDSATKRMASAAGANLQAIGKIAIGGIGAAIATVGGLGLALGKVAVDAAPVEGIQQAFDGLAESAGLSGDEMLAGLRRGSSGMIPARDLMLSFNKAASLVGTEFATQLPDAMQYLGKVSASTGQDMGFLMDSLVTGVGRLSPMILDNLGIQVDLAGATQRASEMFGLEAGELSKSQIQAGMMNVALEKLADNTAAMPDVSQSAAAKLAQFKTTIQDTKDRIGLAFLPTLSTLMTMFGDLAEKVLPPLTTFLENTLAPAIEGVAKFLSNFVIQLGQTDSVWEALTMAFEGTPFEDLQGTFIEIRDAIGGFVDKVREVTDPIFEWISKNVELKDVLIGLGVAIATVVLPVLWGVISAVAPIVGVFLGVVAVVALLRTAWENDFLGIRTALTEFWENTAKPALSALWEWLKVKVPEGLEALRTFWVDTAWPAIQGAIETVWPIIEGIFQSIASFVTDQLIPTIQDLYTKWTEEVWPTIQTVTENVWTVISGIFEEIGRWINDNIVPWVELLKTTWAETVWPAIQTALETAWGVIEPIWESLKEWLADKLPPALEGLRTTFETIMTAIQTAIQPVKDLWDAFSTAIERFWGWISDKTFNFKINLPNLPDWAVPGSPLPIHTAWKQFAQDINSLTIHPAIDLDQQYAELPGVSREGSGGTGSTQIIIYGLTIEGVENPEGLLAQLQAMA